jgi:hypothetical protein
MVTAVLTLSLALLAVLLFDEVRQLRNRRRRRSPRGRRR